MANEPEYPAAGSINPERKYKPGIIFIPIGLILTLIITICRIFYPQLANKNHTDADVTSLNFGNSLYDDGDYKMAIIQYSIAIQSNPKFGQAYNNRGLAYQAQGDREKALADFTQAIQFLADSAAPYSNRGALYMANGDYQRALVDLELAIKQDPKSAKAYYNRGLTYLKLEQPERAILDLDKAIALTPEDTWVLTNRLTGQSGPLGKSIGSSLENTASYANLPLAYAMRGLAYLDKGDFISATADLDQAIRLEPKSASAYYYRAVAYFAQGDAEKASADFRKYSELGGDPVLEKMIGQPADEIGRILSLYLAPTPEATLEMIATENTSPTAIETAGNSPALETVGPTPTFYTFPEDVWTSNSAENKDIRSLAMDLTNPDILYAGIDAKSMANHRQSSLIKSTDGGRSWKPAESGLPVCDIWSLAIDPLNPGIIYAGANFDGLFKSLNGGEDWYKLNTGLPYLTVNALAVHPVHPDWLYAGTSNGVLKSQNGGELWFGVDNSPRPGSVYALAIDPVSPATLYAGSDDLYKSSDGGESWRLIDFNLPDIGSPDIFSLAIDPQQPATLYAGTWDGFSPSGGSVFKSTDGGDSWNQMNNGLPSLTIRSLAIDPLEPDIIYAGTDQGVYKSTNGGRQWIAFNAGLTPTFITGLAIDPRQPGIVYAGAWGGGVYGIHQQGAER